MRVSNYLGREWAACSKTYAKRSINQFKMIFRSKLQNISRNMPYQKILLTGHMLRRVKTNFEHPWGSFFERGIGISRFRQFSAGETRRKRYKFEILIFTSTALLPPSCPKIPWVLVRKNHSACLTEKTGYSLEAKGSLKRRHYDIMMNISQITYTWNPK